MIAEKMLNPPRINKLCTSSKMALCAFRLNTLFSGMIYLSIIVSFQLLSADYKPEIIIVSDDHNPDEVPDFASILIRNLQAQLADEFIFTPAVSTHRRAWRLLTALPNVCIYNKVKTEQRERLAVFTKYPITVFPPNRLITFDSHNIAYNVSLTKLVTEEKLKIGVVDGRSYGKKLDEEIAKVRADLVILPGYLSSKRLRKILTQKKIDAIIEYSAVIANDKDLVTLYDRFSFHQLDSATEFVSGYIACSKSVMGVYAIQHFNQVLHLENNIKLLIKENQQVFSESEHKPIEQVFNTIHSSN